MGLSFIQPVLKNVDSQEELVMMETIRPVTLLLCEKRRSYFSLFFQTHGFMVHMFCLRVMKLGWRTPSYGSRKAARQIYNLQCEVIV